MREKRVSEREKRLSEREKRVSEREKRVSERIREGQRDRVSVREKEPINE